MFRPMRSCATALFVIALGSASAFAQSNIIGSAHDFSTAGWNTSGEICLPCHTPHNADTTTNDAPLWNHTLTTQTYNLYSSTTLNATLGQPTGVSKLCLSCHDGTVAIDAFGGMTGTTFIDGDDAVGGSSNNDLTNDHPISFSYNTALATADGELFDPSTTTTALGGTIDDDLLFSNRMECASCHDVHNTDSAGNNHLLRINNTGSALCLTCHDK